MKEIHIEFTKSSKRFAVLSWVIQKVQRTPYSHVRFRWKTGWGENVVYEASGSTVKFIGSRAFKKLKAEVVTSYTFNLTSEQYRELIKVCMSYAGLPYSLKQVVGIGLVQLGITKKNIFSNGIYGQVCSEVVTRVIEKIYNINLNLDPDNAGPKEIEQELKNVSKKLDN